MPTSQIHTEDGPTKFRSKLNDEDGSLDLTTATMKYIFKKPDATVESFAATIDPDDSTYMEYDTESGYFSNFAGVWQYEAVVTISGGTYYSDIGQFSVLPVLK